MGKYENMMKCAQVRSLANEKQYRNAYEVLQTLNIDQITAITDLNTIADVYIQLQKYGEARDVYLKLYNRIHTRRVLYQLVYLSVKCGEIEEAEEYYSEYEELDKSCDRIILRYYIDKAKGAGRQTLIGHLRELKKEEYMEEWAYELAKLYHKEGMREECIQECSDIVLWFGEGLIVEKALLLKHHYMDGADISSEKAIMEETRNLAAELKIAAAIAEKNEREQAEREARAVEESMGEPVHGEQEIRGEEPVYEETQEEGYGDGYQDTQAYAEQGFYEEEGAYAEQGLYEQEPAYAEQGLYEEEGAYAEQGLYEEEPVYAGQEAYEENSAYAEQEGDGEEAAYGGQPYDMREPSYPVSEAHGKEAYWERNQEENFGEEVSGIEREIAKIVKDIKKEREPGHIAVTGEVSDKNIEIGKYLAKELFRQQVLPTSRIARINAERLNEVSLQENREKLMGGCLLIEEASKLSLPCIQNLYQFIHKARGEVVVILSDTEENMEGLLKKNRKLGSMVEYHIEI